MKVLVIGSHGKVGQRLVKLLSEMNYEVRAMIRKEAQIIEMEKLGGSAFFADLDKDFSSAFSGMDIVIFSAGSGGQTGPEKTIDIDQNAAIRSVDLALKYRIKRYLMVSAQGARDPDAPSKIQHYYKAKKTADDYLIRSGQTYTIFRPGRLTEGPGTGNILAKEFIETRGETNRDNLARAIACSLHLQNTANKTIEILDGVDSIEWALAQI